ncbi:MAG: tyrosine-type recombinase/integrase [Pseudolysinimonas sp.]
MPKKRSNGDGALYYVASRKLWKGVIDVGFGPDGKRKQRSVTSRTQVGAREKLDALRDEIKEHGAPLDKQTSVETWAWRWLREVCQPRMKPNGLAAYESIVRAWIVPVLGHRRVATLKPSDVRAVSQAIIAAGRSPSTALKAYNVLSGLIEEARREGMIAKNVAKDVDAPSAAPIERRALTHDEAMVILRTSAAELDGTRWWMAILEGLRQSERTGAQIADLDLDKGVYHVRWTLDEIASEHGCGEPDAGRWPCGKKQGAACPQARLKVPLGFKYRHLKGRLCLVPPKSGRARTVPLVPPLVEALRRYLVVTGDRPNPYGLIWRNEDGSPILAADDEQAWRDVMQRGGLITADQALAPRHREEEAIDVPTSHTARHTTVTVLIELGVPLKVIGEIVGHQAERTTEGYHHVSSAAAVEAMAGVGARFAEALELPAIAS